MPEKLKRQIVASLRGKPSYKGRSAEESAYAIMNSMGAMKGSKVTKKGRRMERKIHA